MTNTINTSIAKTVNVDLYNINSVPLSLSVFTKVGGVKQPADLSGYAIRFDLYKPTSTAVFKSYAIAPGQTTSQFIDVIGNKLLTQRMWEDLRIISQNGSIQKLLMVVTQPDGYTFVYAQFIVNARIY
jgi:hypothetical protein